MLFRSDKRSNIGAIGGGDLVMKADGKQYLDLYTYQSSDNYAGAGYTSSVIASFSRPFELSGYSNNAAVGYATTMKVEGFNVGFGTNNPRKTTVKQSESLDIYNSDLYVGIGNTRGVVLTSPNGTAFRITVDNSGNLTTVQL